MSKPEHVLIPAPNGLCEPCANAGSAVGECSERNSSGLSCDGEDFIVVKATPETIAKAAAYRLGVKHEE